MASMLIEVPEELKPVGDAMRAFLAMVGTSMAATANGRAVDYVELERQFGEASARIERSGHEVMLHVLDVDARQVRIRGENYVRVGRGPAPYYTLAGAVTVTRSLYRKAGERNGATVDPVSLRAGTVGDGWLPQAAKAMSFLVQQAPSRDAEKAAAQMGRLPYSRASFERVTHEVGALYSVVQTDVEEALIQEERLPEEAHAIAVGLDRVSVPMEEPRARPVGRPARKAPKRPVERNFRMAFAGTVTIVDKNGEALRTLRCGRMPKGDAKGLCDGMASDVAELLRKRPGLLVAAVTDGAPEMRDRLRAALTPAKIGVVVHELVDFWHVIEKLGKAAAVIHGGNAATAIQRWKLRLLNRRGAVWSVLTELRDSGCETVRVGDEQPVHEAITYLENHGERMGYAAARARGLPIGSGNTEATCKSLFDVRLKRSGSRWKEATGEHVVQLRAVALSDRWDAAIDLALRECRAPVRVAA